MIYLSVGSFRLFTWCYFELRCFLLEFALLCACGAFDCCFYACDFGIFVLGSLFLNLTLCCCFAGVGLVILTFVFLVDLWCLFVL